MSKITPPPPQAPILKIETYQTSLIQPIDATVLHHHIGKFRFQLTRVPHLFRSESLALSHGRNLNAMSPVAITATGNHCVLQDQR